MRRHERMRQKLRKAKAGRRRRFVAARNITAKQLPKSVLQHLLRLPRAKRALALAGLLTACRTTLNDPSDLGDLLFDLAPESGYTDFGAVPDLQRDLVSNPDWLSNPDLTECGVLNGPCCWSGDPRHGYDCLPGLACSPSRVCVPK